MTQQGASHYTPDELDALLDHDWFEIGNNIDRDKFYDTVQYIRDLETENAKLNEENGRVKQYYVDAANRAVESANRAIDLEAQVQCYEAAVSAKEWEAALEQQHRNWSIDNILAVFLANRRQA